jgi:hypothetical protein
VASGGVTDDGELGDGAGELLVEALFGPAESLLPRLLVFMWKAVLGRRAAMLLRSIVSGGLATRSHNMNEEAAKYKAQQQIRIDQ